MVSSLVFFAQSLIGDGRYRMIRERELCERGFKEYAPQFLGTKAPRSLLFCVPEHCNIGDHAIAFAERRMLLSESSRPLLEFSGDMAKVLRCVQKYVTPEDTIYLHGGGNMGTLYQNEERYRCDILSLVPHNKIVLFPQTISYEDTPKSQQYLRHTQTIYGRCKKNLNLFAREEVSLERMNAYYVKNSVCITPDIVLSLTDQVESDPASRTGILLCMRNDVEKTTSISAQTILETAAQATGETVSYTDTTIDNKFAPISKERGEKLVIDKFNEFRKAKLVITDRLHGMIFSAVTGTPCIAMNNSTGKVGFEYQWLKDFPYIAFAHSAEETVNLIPQVLQQTVSSAEATALLKGLSPAFNPLRELID